jgi:hypothetical protein
LRRANDLKFTLSEKDKEAVERAINARGIKKVELVVRDGAVLIYRVESKKIN